MPEIAGMLEITETASKNHTFSGEEKFFGRC